ncbi:hypothetical protein CYR55_20415 [Chimaeribacter californicus]|uniref:Uncharacterized protein n=1 Tax=Chimaeribacter californicus TaxID=2060067 RepID=A0A2N5DW53_9GAMM|nr:hypothetical protein [Chimaeribacter californicus]PLR31432.1 hypothetical protein CYR55_20415 [Chimaeribacter californicus]
MLTTSADNIGSGRRWQARAAALPTHTGIDATSSVPEGKSLADYILLLPLADIAPIYIYLSKPP